MTCHKKSEVSGFQPVILQKKVRGPPHWTKKNVLQGGGANLNSCRPGTGPSLIERQSVGKEGAKDLTKTVLTAGWFRIYDLC